MRLFGLGSLLALTASLRLSLSTSARGEVSWRNISISASSNSRYLHRTVTGEPMLWTADTNWELFHRLNRTDADLYLADRAAKGFTVIQAVLLSKLNATTIPNFYGHLAIDNSDPYQINEGYFTHVHWIVQRAAEYGLLIAFVPIWGRYVSGGFFGSPILYDEGSMENFGRYLGLNFPGIPIIMGGDTNAFWVQNITAARTAWRADTSLDPWALLGPVEDTRYLWAAMLRGLRGTEHTTGFEAFVTYQPTNPSITGTPPAYGHNYINGSFGTLSMDAVQSGHESLDPTDLDAGFTALTGWDSRRNYESITAMREHFAGPVMDVENHYEDANDAFNTSKRLWNASDVRHGFYPALFSGACGVTYGCLSVQQSYAPLADLARPDLYIEPQLNLPANASWRIGLHRPGATQTGHVAQLFFSLNEEAFGSLEPNRSFLSSPEGVVEDILAYKGDRYIAGLVSNRKYWAYSGHGDAFDVDLTALNTHWHGSNAQGYAQWFDPREGQQRNANDGKLFQLRGRKTFVPPSSGGVDHDWILIIGLGEDWH